MAVTFKDGVILGGYLLLPSYHSTLQCGLQNRLCCPLRFRTRPGSQIRTDVNTNFRCRLENDNRRIYRKPSYGQADKSPRYYLVLPIRFRRRHASRGRYCTLPAGVILHAQRQAPHDANGGSHLPGNLLLQQRPPVVRYPSPTAQRVRQR